VGGGRGRLPAFVYEELQPFMMSNVDHAPSIPSSI
jgi:hypothetical protein